MLRPVFARMALVLIAVASAACARSSSAAATDGVAAAGAPRRDRTQISAEELKDTPAQNLYEVVQRLHPEWLITRNQGGSGSGRSRSSASSDQAGVQVYMDTQRIGNAEMLRQLAVNSATSLKYYSASDAQARFGNGNMNGAIQIISVATKR